MQITQKSLVLWFSSLLSFSASVLAWNPGSNWQDSYAVDGQCYCNSSNFDHELDTKFARTPMGEKNVVEVCSDITAALGRGAQPGRIPFNDIQCGHGPYNNARDETGCPGRVDQGNQGCNVVGPRWNLEQVYGPWPMACQASKSLEANAWTMISMPCDVQLPKQATVRAVIADDLDAATINVQWAIFQLLTDGTYQQLGLDDELVSGVGYWLITRDNNRVIDVSGEFAIPVDIALRNASGGAWSLVGNPFNQSVGWDRVQVVNRVDGRVGSLANSSPSLAVCAPPAGRECAVANLGYVWAGEDVGYRRLDSNGGELQAFDGVWMFAARDDLRVRVGSPD